MHRIANNLPSHFSIVHPTRYARPHLYLNNTILVFVFRARRDAFAAAEFIADQWPAYPTTWGAISREVKILCRELSRARCLNRHLARKQADDLRKRRGLYCPGGFKGERASWSRNRK